MERSQKPLRHSETKAAGTALGGGTRVRGSRPVWTSSSQLPRKAASPAADQSTAAAGSFGGEVAEAGGEQLVDGDGAGQGALAELVIGKAPCGLDDSVRVRNRVHGLGGERLGECGFGDQALAEQLGDVGGRVGRVGQHQGGGADVGVDQGLDGGTVPIDRGSTDGEHGAGLAGEEFAATDQDGG